MGEIRVNIANEIHKMLKQKAIDENTSLKELVPRIIEEYLKPKASKQNSKKAI